MSADGIRREGPPRAIQKLRENQCLVQVLLSEAPSADWKRLFYDLQRDAPADFPARAVDISGTALRFRSDAGSVEEKITLVDLWIERANQKEARIGVRSEEERQRRERMAREQEELAELNASGAKL